MYILKELRVHAPFTIFGALTGIILLIFFRAMPAESARSVFYVLHPLHVVLSALATASMFRLHTCRKIRGACVKGQCNLWQLLIIGYLGAIGIATLSDSLIPYLGELMLDLPNRGVHLGFIEKWWLVNPLAITGALIACLRPSTKFPHAGHVLLSTWASLFHMLMAVGESLSWVSYAVIFVFLFLAVWVPCCISDIVFPLIVAGREQARR
ncbi:MAG: hypothetical protein ACOCVH_02885 [Verrucomicrobiota bacterium]